MSDDLSQPHAFPLVDSITTDNSGTNAFDTRLYWKLKDEYEAAQQRIAALEAERAELQKRVAELEAEAKARMAESGLLIQEMVDQHHMFFKQAVDERNTAREERDNLEARCSELEAWQAEVRSALLNAGNTMGRLSTALEQTQQECEDLKANAVQVRDYGVAMLRVLAPECKPLDSAFDVLTQIDNFVTGMRKERDKLRAFCLITLSYSDEDICGGDLQEVAVKFGLLVLETHTEPCKPAGCHCAEFGFPAECYRKTPLLTGGE